MRTGITRAIIVFMAVGLLVLALVSPVIRQSPPAEPTTPVVPTRDADYQPVSSNLSADLFPAPPRSP
ncbi:hypothetical protein CFAEC_10385 [Corynebacterium faecale]|nr:hypothetical protein CFAEC_10385 [Corynebacterium faecale]